jgi:prepilin-type N-terminal cleavage/methylation domain-containing protein
MITKERIELTRKGGSGFTLIEILIVVAIIAILASVVLVGLGPTQQAGRDARRISDLSEAQNGLELYYNKCGTYPGGAATTQCAAVTLGGSDTAAFTAAGTAIIGAGIGISSWPVDPTNASPHQYGYAENGGDSYVLQAVLENTNNSVFSTYTAPADYTTDETPAELACTNAGDYCVSL